MNKRINEIKDRVYEAEGLLELLQLRNDKIAELTPLILARIDEARGLIASLAPNAGVAEVEMPAPAATPKPRREPEVEFEPEFEFDEKSEVTAPDETPVENIDKTTPDEDSPIHEAPTPADFSDKSGKGVKPAFCLNDKFRFRRTLFGGSDKAFAETMDRVAAMDSYEEAEEYFFGEEGFDPENEDVMAFMEILKEYFGK